MRQQASWTSGRLNVEPVRTMSGYKRFKDHRLLIGDRCAAGCGGVVTNPDSIYCNECIDSPRVSPPPTEHDMYLVINLFEEKMRGGRTLHRRLEREGTRPCVICGLSTFAWFLTCSDRCSMVKKGCSPKSR